MKNRHGIGFAKDTHNNIETDCHTCIHKGLCFRLKAIKEIKLPLPFEITFVCCQFKKENEANNE